MQNTPELAMDKGKSVKFSLIHSALPQIAVTLLDPKKKPDL